MDHSFIFLLPQSSKTIAFDMGLVVGFLFCLVLLSKNCERFQLLQNHTDRELNSKIEYVKAPQVQLKKIGGTYLRPNDRFTLLSFSNPVDLFF